MNKVKVTTVFLLCLAMTSALFAQKREKIRYKADELENVKVNKVKFRKLIGNVVFKQGTTTVYCDSSYFYNRENRMEAFGRVRIVDGDSVTITSRKLIYEGNFGKARLREDVIYKSGDKTLYTDFLDYNMILKIGDFQENGKMVDPTNTLTSVSGVFYARSDFAVFYEDVKLVSPNYTLYADTLEYSTVTKIAVTKGSTQIVSKDSTVINAEAGEFKTARDQTIFDDGVIETASYILEGDELFLDDAKQYYRAIGHVKLTHKTEAIVITGEEGIYDQDIGTSKIFGSPLLKKLMKRDTFFLAADTLLALETDSAKNDQILAYNKVKFFEPSIQGVADSAVYFQADSLLYLYRDPVLWNRGSQMIADSIDILFEDDLISEMNLRRNSFLISKDTLGQYNQIKGRSMKAFFKESMIQAIDVNGNGESLYYALEGDSLLMGMNKIFCSNMRIRFNTGKLTNISFYKSPEAQFIPPHELTPAQIRLEGFNWRETERPELEDVAPYYGIIDLNVIVPMEGLKEED